MSVKRRNHGRSKKNKGLAKTLRCNNCGRVAGKDKAIKRYTVRDIVDGSSLKDIKESLATPKMIIPKIYEKKQYCISCAVHARMVRVRSAADRKIREAPKRVRRVEKTN